MGEGGGGLAPFWGSHGLEARRAKLGTGLVVGVGTVSSLLGAIPVLLLLGLLLLSPCVGTAKLQKKAVKLEGRGSASTASVEPRVQHCARKAKGDCIHLVPGLVLFGLPLLFLLLFMILQIADEVCMQVGRT